MTALLIATLALIILGIPVALLVDRNARGLLLLGTAYLYGNGVILVVLLALSAMHIRWTIVTVTIAALVVLIVSSLSPRRGERVAGGRVRGHWVDLLTFVTLIGYSFYATLASVWEWDYWAIWGLKARVFFEHGGIDWRFLESRWNVFAHADYPMLLPANYTFVALVNGSWSDRWLGFVMVAFAAAILLVVRHVTAQETTPLFSALITATVATIAMSRYIGLAEGPLIAVAGAAVLMLRRAVLFDDAAALRHGALLLGLATNVKNEGVALAVSVVIAIAILRPRLLLRLWPAAALAAPWLVLRAAHVLPTDIVGGSPLSRVIARLPYTAKIFGLLGVDLVDPTLWVLLIAGIAVAVNRRRELFIWIVTAMQLVFYAGSYFATPHDPRWHIVTSWPRLTMQIALPLVVTVLLMLAISLTRDAEARPVD